MFEFEDAKKLLLDMLKGAFSRNTEKKRTRKIIFWYDAKRDYEKFIDELEIDGTEIIKYDNNSFWIRYHVEKEELNKNIVIYVPFEKFDDNDNSLLDLFMANRDLVFNPDDVTMRLREFNLFDDCRDVVSKYTKFFGNKKRRLEFNSFDILEKNSNNIDFIVTAILLNMKSVNQDELLKNIVRYYYDDLKRYEDLFKYGSEEFILGMFSNFFGRKISSKNELPDLYKALIFTYFVANVSKNYNVDDKIGRYSKYLWNEKATNICVFINSLMRDKVTKIHFEKLSNDVEKEFGIVDLIKSLNLDDYKSCDAFKCIDIFVIKYITDGLIYGILEFDKYKDLIDLRENKYWFDKFRSEYKFLSLCIEFFKRVRDVKNLIKVVDIDSFAKLYMDSICDIDTLYRKIYFYYDSIVDKDMFIELKNRVENIYVNDFMSDLSIKWSESLEMMKSYDSKKMVMQNKFYDTFIKPFSDKKDRIIVIISDGFRYECACELNNRLKEISSKSDISGMLGVVPSYTKLGMAALLPNRRLSKTSKSDDVLVDGKRCSSVRDRELILQNDNVDSIAVKYDSLYEMTKLEWKKMFSGKRLVYIYHDVIDKVGEHNENKVFEACSNAIDDLERLVRDLHTTFSGVNVFITADHGFFYKRSKIEAYEKTDKNIDSVRQKTRYSYSNNVSDEEGIMSINLDYIFGYNSGYVNIPKGNIVFARQGMGFSYMHGGLLPQEILIPVIDFKSTRTSDMVRKVGITYSGLSTRITNVITYLEFLQDNNVDDNNKACRYLVHFEDEDGNRISDECTIVANYRDTKVKDRFFREKFVFKNISYDKGAVYYLVIIDEETELEYQRLKFYIDIAIVE